MLNCIRLSPCLYLKVGFLGSSGVKNLSATQETQETRVQFLGWEDPLEEGMEPTPVFLPEVSRGQRILVDYSPEGRNESDTTEATLLARAHTHTHTHKVQR